MKIIKDDRSIVRGDLFYADLSPVIGSEQGGVRPVVIIQNDIGNKYSPTTIVAAITSVRNKSSLPTHVQVEGQTCGLPKESVILMEQIRTIDKKRLKEKIGRLDDSVIHKINKALKISISLEE
ncbi:MAG: type II toxin-antitoxin system PemK/MazF family toxin [Tissierellia bacterium]|nr:type II toxin-antitoxin system PemK/MazF family toxin [Tissierellia bacterium]